MPLSVKNWWVRHVGETGHGCVMNFDHRYNGDDFDNVVKLSKIQKRPSWEVYVDFFSQMDPSDPSYPYFANISDNDNFFQLPLPHKISWRAGIQYGTEGSYGPIPSGVGRHNVKVDILNKDSALLISQAGYYVIEAG